MRTRRFGLAGAGTAALGLVLLGRCRLRGSDGSANAGRPPADDQGDLLRLGRDASGPGRQVRRGGRDADHGVADERGVKGQNGLLQGFPPNTGVGWYTLATGTWPGEHGSTNNTFHRIGEGNFNNRTSFATTGILQADTIQQAAERAGKKVASMEWVGLAQPHAGAPGAGRRLPHLLRTAASCSTTTCPGSRGRERFGVSYQRVDLAPASGWTNVPRRSVRRSRSS